MRRHWWRGKTSLTMRREENGSYTLEIFKTEFHLLSQNILLQMGEGRKPDQIISWRSSQVPILWFCHPKGFVAYNISKYNCLRFKHFFQTGFQYLWKYNFILNQSSAWYGFVEPCKMLFSITCRLELNQILC